MLAHSAPTLAPKTTIYYPETDHQPIPDGEYQVPLLVQVCSTLSVHFSKTPGARVNGNVFLYYEAGNPRRTVTPAATSLLILPLRRFNPCGGITHT